MSGLVGIEWKFPKLREGVQQRMEEIILFVAAQLQTNRGEMFDNNNSGRFNEWAKPKLRRGQPLSHTGTLRKSFAPMNDGKTPVVGPDGIVRVSGDNITIGTKIAYASILNNGGVIRPKRFPVLWIPLPEGRVNSSSEPSDYAKKLKKGKVDGPPIVKGRDGRYYLLAKRATIPKRPMDEWTTADQEELEVALVHKLEQVFTEIING